MKEFLNGFVMGFQNLIKLLSGFSFNSEELGYAFFVFTVVVLFLFVCVLTAYFVRCFSETEE